MLGEKQKCRSSLQGDWRRTRSFFKWSVIELAWRVSERDKISLCRRTKLSQSPEIARLLWVLEPNDGHLSMSMPGARVTHSPTTSTWALTEDVNSQNHNFMRYSDWATSEEKIWKIDSKLKRKCRPWGAKGVLESKWVWGQSPRFLDRPLHLLYFQIFECWIAWASLFQI